MKLFIKNIFFIFFHYIPIVYKIKKLSVSNISIYKFRNWHFGYCYFVGYRDGKKVFIKIDTKVGVLENEWHSYQILRKDPNIQLIKAIDFVKYSKTQVIILEFLEGRELLKTDILTNPKHIETIFKALKTINKHNIIHRDIKLDNFLLVEEELYIIDFCFACHLKQDKNPLLKELPLTKLNCLWLKHLGVGLSPEEYEWNDFYAFSNILKDILEGLDEEEELKKILLKYKNIISHEVSNNTYKISCIK